MSSRKLAVNGQFYPNSSEEIQKYITHFNNILENNNITVKPKQDLKAIIVPHAGYVYSGFTANFAYRYIPDHIENIIVIGPSHKFRFEGASVANYDSYPTPLGDLKINTHLTKKLLNSFDFLGFEDKIHCEHSTEVQFPFIKNYLENKSVLEIVYGKIDFNDLSKMIEQLMDDQDNFIIISTDLSHFYDLDTAKSLDNLCLGSIINKDLNIDKKGCEACGIVGVKAMLKTAEEFNLSIKLLDYRTSADTSKDKTSVVGYSSFLIS